MGNVTTIPTNKATKPDAFITSIEDRIVKPSGKVNTIGAMIYGRFGSGKTTLLGTMPGKGLVIDIPQLEGGSNVLEDQQDHVDVITITHWDELEDMYKYLLANPRGYDWAAVDSVSATQTLAKRKTIKDRLISADPHVVTQQEYGKIADLQAEFAFKFRLLPMHVLFTAQERSRTDEGLSIVGPALTPAAWNGIGASLHLVGRLYTQGYTDAEGNRKLERRMRVGQHPQYEAKCRVPMSRPMPDIISEPNLKEIFGYMLGGRKQPPTEAKEAAAIGIIEI